MLLLKAADKLFSGEENDELAREVARAALGRPAHDLGKAE